jgi:acyl-coenzyme A thioesterase PaaI-like protein
MREVILLRILRAAQGERLRCKAEVLKPGRRFTVVESEVFALAEDKSTMVAKAMVTLAVLERTRDKIT